MPRCARRHIGLSSQKFEAILAGEKKMGLAAHNLGKAELALGAPYLRRGQTSRHPLRLRQRHRLIRPGYRTAADRIKPRPAGISQS